MNINLNTTLETEACSWKGITNVWKPVEISSKIKVENEKFM